LICISNTFLYIYIFIKFLTGTSRVQEFKKRNHNKIQPFCPLSLSSAHQSLSIICPTKGRGGTKTTFLMMMASEGKKGRIFRALEKMKHLSLSNKKKQT
jgi:hypothetical protein